MKKLISVLRVLSVVVLIIVASCKKDSNILTASMTAKINLNAWDASLRVTVLQGGNFIITGTSLTGEIIEITTYGSAQGTYILQTLPPIVQFTALYKENATVLDQNAFAATSGQVFISKIDATEKKISGTFNFDARDLGLNTVSITQGTFTDLIYTEN